MNHNLNVLFIDDSQSNVEITAAEFKKQGFHIKYDHISTCNDLMDRLRNNRYDLAVSDYNLSATSVTEVLNLLSTSAYEMPLIVISDHNNEDDIVKCIKAGCRDYLLKDNISQLKLAVVRTLCDVERHRQGKEAQKQLLEQNDYLATTLENIGDGLIVTDLNGQVTLMNNTAQKLTGHYINEASGVYLEEVLRLSRKNGFNLIRPIFDQVIKTGIPSGLKRDTVLTTYNGDKRYVSAMVSPVKTNKGVITGGVIIFRDITRLRGLEKELEQEHKKLSAILDAVPVGLVILDRNLVIRRVNPVLGRYMEKSIESMLNRRIGNSIRCVNSTQNSRGCGYGDACKFCGMRKVVSDVRDTETPVYGKEIQHAVLAGANRIDFWLRVNAVPITIRGNKHVILAVDDITESKRSEEALVKSRDFYLTLFESFPVLIRRAGQDAKYNYFNRSWLEFTGRTVDEEMRDGWISGVYPDDLQRCVNTYNEAFKARKGFELEYRLCRSDGKYRWIYDAGRPFYDVEGNFLGYINSCYDITEKKNEIEILNKYQLLSQEANDIIIFIDAKGNIIEVNEAAISVYGYTKEEFKMLTLFDLRKSDDFSIINEHLDTVRTRSIFFNTTHYRKDGSSFPVEASWSGANIGNEQMILCVVRDVSERKKFQESLENRNKELRDALERLKETQGHLLQQEKLAAIGHLAAGVAHEINNPLGFIMSNIETLGKYSIRLKEVIAAYGSLRSTIEQSCVEECRQGFAEIGKLEREYHINWIAEDLKALIDDTNDGLDRISKIVTGLRVFSREDKQDEMTDYDLNEGVENTLMIANSEIKYHADIERNFDDIPPVKLLGSHINQVLLNLVINAVHAVKEKQDGQRGLIRISTYRDDKYVCCDIEDNGIGIPEENLNKIFNPFYTTKPVGQGTGLGLSISYDIIVNKHGGELSVKSTPGKGTVFTIRLWA
ncbi:MAG: PAS domain S-box protein [Bacillota bacterium]